MALPENPIFKLHWIETRRGLFPKEERSLFKVSVIMEEHAVFMFALKKFIENGNSLVIIPGNHDVEFHFEKVQKKFIEYLDLT
jgi:UDP-2,3-diacylglucosamine pyrophosphatase LpxH